MLRALMRVAMTIAATVVLVVCSAGMAIASRGVSEDVVASPGGLVVHGSHGFVLVVDTRRANRGRPAQVAVSAEREGNLLRYTAPADLSGEGIHAALGPFGRIDLRWVPDGSLGEVTYSCHGHGRESHILFARGAYVGTFRFRGGNGFTAVRAHRVEWRRAWYSGYNTCRHRRAGSIPGGGKLLRATAGVRSPAARFLAYQPKPGAPVEYEAADHSAVGPVKVERTTWTRGGPRTLTSSNDLAAVTVEPPAPFAGTATFSRTAHIHGTWLGDLTVEFADGTVAPMAGEPFAATFHADRTE